MDRLYLPFSKWIEDAFNSGMPDEVVSICFNIYEDESSLWSIEMIGCNRFDYDDWDWACSEVTDFGTRFIPFKLSDLNDWENVQQRIGDMIKNYLDKGVYSEYMQSRMCIAVGFIDGDLNYLYLKK